MPRDRVQHTVEKVQRLWGRVAAGDLERLIDHDGYRGVGEAQQFGDCGPEYVAVTAGIRLRRQFAE